MKTMFGLAAATMMFCAAACAENVTLEISGQITVVDSALASAYSTGSPYSLSLTYNPGGPRVATARLLASGHELNGSGNVIVQNNAPYDEFILAYAPMAGFDIVPYDSPLLYVNFVDVSASLFSNNALPVVFPAFGQWNQVIASLGYEDRGANLSRSVLLRVDAVTVVPEPSASLLLALGASAWIGCRSRRGTPS
jgi:hypothetical protein